MAVINITKENFESQVLKSQKPVLVEFWAPWCVYCRRLSPVLERLAEKLGDEVTVAKVNIDEQSGLDSRYGVDVIPTLYLFKNGTMGEKLVAPESQAQVEQWLQAQA